tara:strand:- start:710 stop:934 length:225 start_codon:yes stop_codon:yes gene_type:complete
MSIESKGMQYVCPKCGNQNYRTEEIRATGSGFSRFMNIQNKKFTGVICSQCGFTEFYSSGKSGMGSNILDMFTG